MREISDLLEVEEIMMVMTIPYTPEFSFVEYFINNIKNRFRAKLRKGRYTTLKTFIGYFREDYCKNDSKKFQKIIMSEFSISRWMSWLSILKIIHKNKIPWVLQKENLYLHFLIRFFVLLFWSEIFEWL